MSTTTNGRTVEIVEVGPRDGFQPIGPFIPTEVKIRFLERLVAAGVRRIEIGSFVSAKAVPQLRDTAEVLAATATMPDLVAQVLVPSERRGRGSRGEAARVRAIGLGGAQPQQRAASSAGVDRGV
jgi:hydroxymethylglutaryl-CoA lyase